MVMLLERGSVMQKVIMLVGEITPNKIEIRAYWPTPEGHARAMEDEAEFIRTGTGAVSYSAPIIRGLGKK
jgi:hypothetical protein